MAFKIFFSSLPFSSFLCFCLAGFGICIFIIANVRFVKREFEVGSLFEFALFY